MSQCREHLCCVSATFDGCCCRGSILIVPFHGVHHSTANFGSTADRFDPVRNPAALAGHSICSAVVIPNENRLSAAHTAFPVLLPCLKGRCTFTTEVPKACTHDHWYSPLPQVRWMTPTTSACVNLQGVSSDNCQPDDFQNARALPEAPAPGAGDAGLLVAQQAYMPFSTGPRRYKQSRRPSRSAQARLAEITLSGLCLTHTKGM